MKIGHIKMINKIENLNKEQLEVLVLDMEEVIFELVDALKIANYPFSDGDYFPDYMYNNLKEWGML